MEDSSQAEITHEAAAGQILLSGLGDWVSFDEALSYVRDDHPGSSDEDRIDAALRVLEMLLRHGLVVAGDLRPEFVPWALDALSSLEAISRTARDPHRSPGIGTVCWLANTPSGDALAETIRREKP